MGYKNHNEKDSNDGALGRYTFCVPLAILTF